MPKRVNELVYENNQFKILMISIFYVTELFTEIQREILYLDGSFVAFIINSGHLASFVMINREVFFNDIFSGNL